MVGIGGALYPQAIQRIYAARSQRVLRNGVAMMAFLPLTASLIAVFVGVTAAASPELATLTDADSDRVFGEVCRIVMAESSVPPLAHCGAARRSAGCADVHRRLGCCSPSRRC